MIDDNKFLKKDFFIGKYLDIDTDEVDKNNIVKEINDEEKKTWKEIYGFIHMLNQEGRNWSKADVINLCEKYLISEIKIENAFKKIYEKIKRNLV